MPNCPLVKHWFCLAGLEYLCAAGSNEQSCLLNGLQFLDVGV